MSETDSFINEVTEELKRDRLYKLWRRYGVWVIGGIVLIVAGTATMNWLEHQRIQAARAAGAQLIEAAQAGDPARQAEAFAKVATSAEGGPAIIARFAEAAALAEAGDAEAAARALDAIAALPEVDSIYRDLAAFKAHALRAPSMTPEARIAALGQFIVEGAPFRLLALEARAVAALELGDADAARADLEQILADQMTTVEMRQRVSQLQTLLGVGGA